MPNNLCILFKYENILTIALNLTFFGHPLHNITAVSYNGPPLLSLHCNNQCMGENRRKTVSTPRGRGGVST